MNILILGAYGAKLNIQLAEIMTFVGLQEKGVNVTIMGTAEEEIISFFKKNELKFIEKKPSSTYDTVFIQELKKYITDNQIDITYVHSGIYFRPLIPAIKKLPTKLVTYYGSSSLYWHDISAYFSYLSPRVTKIMCNSNYVYNHVKKQLFGKNKQKAVRIYKGYDTAWFANVIAFDYTSIGIPQEATVVITVTRNDKVKDVTTFINTIKKLSHKKDIHFVMVGTRIDNEHLKSKIKALPNVKNIHLLGERNDAPQLIKGADIYVQTSLREGLGRAISEAICLSKPVVMTDAGGCVELVEKDVTGFVAPKKDADKLAQYIEELSDNVELRHTMGALGKKRMESELSIQNTVEQIYQLYKSLLLPSV